MARPVFKANGRELTLFSRSIRVAGMVNFIFYNRPVTMDDARQVAELIKLGREEIKEEFKSLIDL